MFVGGGGTSLVVFGGLEEGPAGQQACRLARTLQRHLSGGGACHPERCMA